MCLFVMDSFENKDSDLPQMHFRRDPFASFFRQNPRHLLAYLDALVEQQ